MSVLSDRVLALLSHLQIDETSDDLLTRLVEALLDPAERMSIAAHGDGDLVTGVLVMLTDPAVAPSWALPYAAQWTGGVMPTRLAGESEEDYTARARAEVIQPRGMRRGTAPSLQVIALSYVTGTKTVLPVEHPGADPWHFRILTLADETPDVPALEAALNDPDVIAAGVKAQVDALEAGVWTLGAMEDIYATSTLGALEDDFATLADMEDHSFA